MHVLGLFQREAFTFPPVKHFQDTKLHKNIEQSHPLLPFLGFLCAADRSHLIYYLKIKISITSLPNATLTCKVFLPATCDRNFGCLSFHRHLGSNGPTYKRHFWFCSCVFAGRGDSVGLFACCEYHPSLQAQG